MRVLWQGALTLVMTMIMALAIVYVYYVSPLHERMESRLLDLRERLGAPGMATSEVVVVGIDESSIAAAAALGPELVMDAVALPKTKDLSYAGLAHLTGAILGGGAKALALLLHNNIYSYEDPGMDQVARLAQGQGRLLLGVFELPRTDQANNLVLPPVFRRVSTQVGEAKTARDYRREVPRRVVISKTGEAPTLLQKVMELVQPGWAKAHAKQPRDQAGELGFRINYLPRSALTVVPASAFFSSDAKHKAAALAKLQDKIVVIGYQAFRPWTNQSFEGTHINSPWQADGADVEVDALPLLEFHAMSILNATRQAYLRSVPRWASLCQALVLAVLTFLGWRFGMGFACLWFIGGWSSLLIVHSWIMAYWYVYFPLSDSIAFSMAALVVGGVLRLRSEGQSRAVLEAQLVSQAEIDRVQGLLLHRFTESLCQTNAQIRALLQVPPEATAGAQLIDAHQRLLASTDELEGYLIGLEQLAAKDDPRRHQVKLQKVAVEPIIEALQRGFAHKLEEKNLELLCQGETPALCLGDAYLLQQILYNLLSNAIKYAPEGSTVTISKQRGPGQLTLTVTDQGPGIAEEHQELIFAKFYRIKDDLVYKLKGHGLGLYLCRYFASQIQARVSVSSAPGQGSAFSLTLRAPRRWRGL